MKERPINFKAWEVQAIRAGRKTQFRRVVKNTGLYAIDAAIHGPEVAARELIALASRCPYGAPGDRLWARETWAQLIDEEGESKIYYSANEKDEVVLTDGDGFREWNANGTPKSPWRSPVCMPRRASRITLELVSVRAERLQDISEEDAKAEGIEPEGELGLYRDYSQSGIELDAVSSYCTLWRSINGPGSWGENPWVWVVEFRQV